MTKTQSIIKLKQEILKKIKENVERQNFEIVIDELDSFDDVVNKFQLRARKLKGENEGKLKKDLILDNPVYKELYNQCNYTGCSLLI